MINSLYIHIPFCNSICSYCDFPKLQYFSNFADQYLKKLKIELDSYKINPSEIKTIYIGGGTPTSLSDKQFLILLEMIKPYSINVEEFTIEANPESLSKEKLIMMKNYGVNRLSIGVETTNDEYLKYLNRKHTFDDVKNAVSLARSIGITNINFDLILGLPNMLQKDIKKDIKNILTLNPEHISCYSLTVSKHTKFGIEGVVPQSDDKMREYYDMVNSLLLEEGYNHYEISNWCKPHFESKHNLTYWKDEEYYGIGMGASGYVNDVRYRNTFGINDYLKGVTIKEKEEITLEDDITYFIMLNLRTMFGLDLEVFRNRFGYDFYNSKKKEIDDFIKQGYLMHNDNKIIPTYEGMMILDKIIVDLI